MGSARKRPTACWKPLSELAGVSTFASIRSHALHGLDTRVCQLGWSRHAVAPRMVKTDDVALPQPLTCATSFPVTRSLRGAGQQRQAKLPAFRLAHD
jgi:hypothetical protein